MKQTITRDQLKPLTRAQMLRLKTWCIEHGYFRMAGGTRIPRLDTPMITINDVSFIFDYDRLPLLTIGMMVELLSERNELCAIQALNFGDGKRDVVLTLDDTSRVNPDLCDLLWEAVREVLSQ